MNYGIIQNRRPQKSTSSNPLLTKDPRMREIAKQMGLQAKDFGPEAQQLWKMLDDMALKDPKKYQEFIHEQLKDGPPMPVESPATAAAQDSATADTSATTGFLSQTKLPRFFTPHPGFVVKCVMYYSIKCQQQPTKLFLNCCAHAVVDIPKNPNSNKDVPKDTHAVPYTSNLQIPLLIGKLREIADTSGAICGTIDVVFNDWVIERCGWDTNFKREVMQLAIEWVQRDAKIRLVNPTGKFIKSRYKGGVVVGNEIITAKFPVDPNSQQWSGGVPQSNQEENEVSVSPIDSPSNLLKQINREKKQCEESTRELVITPVDESTARSAHSNTKAVDLILSKEKQQVAKKPLIEEIDSQLTSEKKANASSPGAVDVRETKTKKKRKGSEVVKRGFLNSTNKSLYPKGSSEGRPASSYVNLLHRSKVVDLSDVDLEKTKRESEERQKMFSFLEPTAKSSCRSADREMDRGSYEFDQLCLQADPDLKPQLGRGDEANDSLRQMFGEGFEEFSKFLAS